MYSVEEMLDLAEKCKAINWMNSDKIFDIFFDTLESPHCKDSKSLKSLKWTIGRYLNSQMTYIEGSKCKDTNYFVYYINKQLEEFSVECSRCSKYIGFKSNGRILTEISEPVECFDYGRKTFRIKTKSNEFVILNDLRHYSKLPEFFNEQDINFPSGEYHTAKRYAEHNALAGFVGNTSVEVYKLNDDYYLTSKFNEENMELHPDKFDIDSSKNLGSVCCDLWWIMGADKTELDFEKIVSDRCDYVILDVLPDTEYDFIINMNYDSDDCELGSIFKLVKV